MQHGASVSKGRSAGALCCDLASLPLLQHLSTVRTGALFGGRAETGSLPQAVFLPTQTGPGLYCKMEGQCGPRHQGTSIFGCQVKQDVKKKNMKMKIKVL